MLIPCFNTCETEKTFISLSNNELNLNVHEHLCSHDKVNMSNKKAELYEKMCLLNCWSLLL
mgnify:CR=1 FL=1